MSSISLPYEKQIRHFFPFTAIATETDASTFITSASAGEIQLLMEDGTTTGTGDFYIIKKDATGKVVKSDLITPKDITYMRKTDPVSKTGKVQTFTLSGVTVGAYIGLSIKVHYANSEQNFEYVIAHTKVITGDTANSVLRRLAKQVADNLAASMWTSTTTSGTDTIATSPTLSANKNKYFTVTVASSDLVITEKDWILDGYVPGLKTFDQLMWNAELETKNEDQLAQITKVTTAPVYAKGQGYQMLELERYFVGHRAEFPGPDITLSFNRAYEIDVDTAYYCLDIKYFDVSRNDPYQSDKMLTLVCPTEAHIDTIEAQISALITPVFDPQDYDLTDFTNDDADPFARQSDIV